MQKHERTSHHKASNHCRRSIWFSRLLLAVACLVRSVAQRGARGKERVVSAHAQRCGACGSGRERLLCVCLRAWAREHTRTHADTRARRRVAPTPINPGSRSRRPHGSSWGRTDLPTSEAGTAFRSSPRPDEARFESHARQLCASPIPQPCVLVLLPTLPCAHTLLIFDFPPSPFMKRFMTPSNSFLVQKVRCRAPTEWLEKVSVAP